MRTEAPPAPSPEAVPPLPPPPPSPPTAAAAAAAAAAASSQKPSPPATPTPYHEWRVLAITTLTAIATLIGSGILALPVTLYATSVPLFIVLFTTTMAVQTTVVYAVVELFQLSRVHASEPASASSGPAEYHAIDADAPPAPVSLFTLASLYLPLPALRYAYYVATLLCFVSLMVSYGLAGSQAVWQLFESGTQTAPPTALMVAYWGVGTISVVFFADDLLGVFSSFTVVKGALFVGVVLIVGLLPGSSRVASLAELMSDFSGWQTATGPFLMGCVALCGVTNSMPVTFNLLPGRASAEQIRRYRAAVMVGVVVCYLLNVSWVVAVLQVVPRTAADGAASLTVAYQEGQISTVPLISTLRGGAGVSGGVLRAIEVIIEMFIFVSTGVSFFVNAAAMKSFVDGGVGAAGAGLGGVRGGRMRWVRAVAYTGSFGVVLGIIVVNPKGFITVLTRLSSLTLNVQSGLLLFVMLYSARARRSEIVVRLSGAAAAACIGGGAAFFGVASALALGAPLLGVAGGGAE